MQIIYDNSLCDNSLCSQCLHGMREVLVEGVLFFVAADAVLHFLSLLVIGAACLVMVETQKSTC